MRVCWWTGCCSTCTRWVGRRGGMEGAAQCSLSRACCSYRRLCVVPDSMLLQQRLLSALFGRALIVFTCSPAPMSRPPTHAHTHTCTRAHTLTRTRLHAHAHTHSHALVYTHTRTYTPLCTHTPRMRSSLLLRAPSTSWRVRCAKTGCVTIGCAPGVLLCACPPPARA